MKDFIKGYFFGLGFTMAVLSILYLLTMLLFLLGEPLIVVEGVHI
ncbi:MAG: hypothetical protein QMD92_00180 [bacterium]|nr:hypothetical protein [bacterium]